MVMYIDVYFICVSTGWSEYGMLRELRDRDRELDEITRNFGTLNEMQPVFDPPLTTFRINLAYTCSCSHSMAVRKFNGYRMEECH